MFYFFRPHDPNDPRRGVNRVDNETRRILDDPLGSPLEEGYTRLARADRETGIRSNVGGGEPETTSRYFPD